MLHEKVEEAILLVDGIQEPGRGAKPRGISLAVAQTLVMGLKLADNEIVAQRAHVRQFILVLEKIYMVANPNRSKKDLTQPSARELLRELSGLADAALARANEETPASDDLLFGLSTISRVRREL